MLNKISVTKADSLKALQTKENVKGISTLISIEDFFTWIHNIYVPSKKIETIQKKLTMNSKISDFGKKINFTKILYDANKKNLYIIIATNFRVYIQELEDSKNFKLLLDGDNEEMYITGYYEGNNINNMNNKSNSLSIFLKINETSLVEIDTNKSEILSESIISAFILKNKSEGKNKTVKYELHGKNNILLNSYSIMTNYEDNKNVKSIWKFNEKIVTMKFRPKSCIQDLENRDKKSKDLYDNNNHVAISFNGGHLRVFHYESKALIYNYRTSYGNVICIEYSPDGRLLGLGTESDNVYILDAEFGGLLFCLEGHKNYVTSIIFEAVTEEEQLDNLVKASYDSNEYNSNYNSHSKQNPLANKEITNDTDLISLFTETETNTVVKTNLIAQLKRTRTSVNVNNFVSQEDLRNSTTFDVYTAGLDGNLAVWRIEHFYEEGVVNERNYSALPHLKDNLQIVKIDHPSVVNLIPRENFTVFYTDMVKISKAPLNFVLIDNNVLVYISRRNTSGSYLYLNFFKGENKDSDDVNTAETEKKDDSKKEGKESNKSNNSSRIKGYSPEKSSNNSRIKGCSPEKMNKSQSRK